ncbi:MAG: Ig-like domain-containing protein, partial [Chloroflexota bacterium]
MSEATNRNSFLRTKKLAIWLNVILVVSFACAIPGFNTEPPTDIPVQGIQPKSIGPLPPAIIETQPLSGSQLPLTGGVSFYFNQAVDQASVEAAFNNSAGMSGGYHWEGEDVFIFTPQDAWPPDTNVSFSFDVTLVAANGLTLPEVNNFGFTTTGFLEVTQMLPEADSFEIDPTSAIVVTFNRPIVPLGANMAAQPPAFTMQPNAVGRGEWLNTSTYIFYPDPGLDGGKTYTVMVDQSLTSTDQAILRDPVSWTFATSTPKLLEFMPALDGEFIRLDQPFSLIFNQSMNQQSIESNFSLTDQDGRVVPGEFVWNDIFTQVVFTPLDNLARSAVYSVFLNRTATGQGGAQLGEDHNIAFQSVGDFALQSSQPLPGGVRTQYESVILEFTAPIDFDTLEGNIKIAPQVRDNTFVNENNLSISGNFDPNTNYEITVSGGLKDIWGESLGEAISFPFRTAALKPQLVVPAYLGSGVLHVNPADPVFSVQAVNINTVDVRVGLLPFEDFISISKPSAYEWLQNYVPNEEDSWRISISGQTNNNRIARIPLTQNGVGMTPGLYWTSLKSQDLPENNFSPSGNIALAVVSNINMVYKISAADVFVWAVDIRSNTPAAQKDVVIYNQDGASIARGQTDADGVFTTALVRPLDQPFDRTFAVLSAPGDEYFSLTTSEWNRGLAGWDFGIPVDSRPARTKAYFYTDRPIYRPGQTVNYRAVFREAFNGRYELPSEITYQIRVMDNTGA